MDAGTKFFKEMDILCGRPNITDRQAIDFRDKKIKKLESALGLTERLLREEKIKSKKLENELSFHREFQAQGFRA